MSRSVRSSADRRSEPKARAAKTGGPKQPGSPGPEREIRDRLCPSVVNHPLHRVTGYRALGKITL
jgi:hypothetical protein